MDVKECPSCKNATCKRADGKPTVFQNSSSKALNTSIRQAVTPLLENWAVVLAEKHDPYKAPETYTQYLQGNVHGHPGFDAGTLIVSSPILGKRLVSGEETVVTVSGTVYRLGEVSTDYEAKFNSARCRLFETLPHI